MNAKINIFAIGMTFAVAAGIVAPTGAANAAPLMKAPIASIEPGSAGVLEVSAKKKKVVVHIHKPYYGYGYGYVYYPFPPYYGKTCGVKKVKTFKPGVGVIFKSKRVCW